MQEKRGEAIDNTIRKPTTNKEDGRKRDRVTWKATNKAINTVTQSHSHTVLQ